MIPSLGVMVGLLLALTAGCGGTTTTGTAAYVGTAISPPYPASPVALASTAGGTMSLRHGLGGKVGVVFFGYSHCPDTCQIVMGTIASAYARLSKADQRKVRVVFVTTDPARDTVPVLKTYLGRFNTAFIGLTAPLPAIEKVAKPFHVDIEKGQKLPSGGYEVTHSTYVFGLDGDRGAARVWQSGVSPHGLADDLTRMLQGNR